MEHLIFASYGNDSIALIQWAHERSLPGVHVAYSNTGWAADWWLGRVEQAEAWAQTLGFVTHRIGSEGMAAQPVRCEICQWRGRRLKPRSAPCPACGSRVEYV